MKIREIINEIAYPGNIGMMEVAKFYQIAEPQQIKLFKELLAKGKTKEAWRLIQLVSKARLQGKEFDFDDESIFEGGWASAQTQGTHITPQLVANVMKILLKNFIPRLNKFLTTQQLGPTEISAPGGSATYYERDLKQNPTKEYGDVDVQFHIPRIDGTTNNANADIYRKAIKAFCDQSADFSTDNGTNIILRSGSDFVQVDLIYSYYENKEWTKALRPEWNVKGVLCNSLYSSLGEALNLSFGGGHGVQAKTQGGQIVPFKTVKDVELQTITNNPNTWAVDITHYLGGKMTPLLKKFPGLIGGEPRVADIIMSFKGIAQSLEQAGKIPSASEFLGTVKSIYLAKIDKAINSSKYDKAASPEAQAKAQHTKEMLAAKSQEFARLF